MSDNSISEVTDLKNKLEASESRFYNVVDTSPDGIIVLDFSGVICFVNNAAKSLFSHSIESLIGKEFGFPVVSGEKTEIELLHGSSKRIVAEMRVVNIEWEGQPALLASLRDISKHIMLGNELQTANRELERFAYTVSHDIRAPLRNADTIATWLQEDYSEVFDDKAIGDLHKLKNNVNRVQRLVDGLLQFTQISSLKNKHKAIQLNAVIEEVLDNLSADIAASKSEIVVGALPQIEANDIQLVLLFQNLISNSMKYCENNSPKIAISASKKSGNWEIKVTDNGIGVEEKYWVKIFHPFERLHGKDQYEGSGIGLATCKKIVDQHNGKIWIESIPEQGSTVWISLPDL